MYKRVHINNVMSIESLMFQMPFFVRKKQPEMRQHRERRLKVGRFLMCFDTTEVDPSGCSLDRSLIHLCEVFGHFACFNIMSWETKLFIICIYVYRLLDVC